MHEVAKSVKLRRGVNINVNSPGGVIIIKARDEIISQETSFNIYERQRVKPNTVSDGELLFIYDTVNQQVVARRLNFKLTCNSRLRTFANSKVPGSNPAAPLVTSGAKEM